jgi:hypothetical protein
VSIRKIAVLVALLWLFDVGTALAEVEANDFEVDLYGRWWRVLSYFVEDDLLKNPNEDTFLEPEGLAFAGQLLYVSGDRGEYETDSRLAIYDHPAGGALTFDSYLQMSITGDPDGWGPEGLTFNLSGSGYGSAADELVSVERDGSGRVAVVDLLSGDVTDILATSDPEGVSYQSLDVSFATLQDAGGPVTVAFHDEWFVPFGTPPTVALTTGGVAAIGDTFASFLTRSSLSGEFLLTVAKGNPGNAINVYDLNGLPVGSQQDLPVEPKARIPLGGGFYLLEPAFGEIEAIAVDETNGVIYIGDEGNSMVHVLTPGDLVVYECDDGLDNDGDGLIDDPADPGCADALDTSERDDTGTYPCDDGEDNDSDGRTDFDPVTFANPGDQYTPPSGSGDPGCKDPTWSTESPQCQDGINNDLGQDPNPGRIDYDGGQSIHGYCSDGTCPPGVSDPDGDGVADPDPQCVGKPWKKQERKPAGCGLSSELVFLLPPLIWLHRRQRRRS